MGVKMKILIDAFVEKNLGDDLFLKILFDRYSSNIEWYVICSSDASLGAFQGYRNVKRYDKKILTYKDFDAVINIGGSIFIQGGHWWIKQLMIRLKYAIPMKLRHRPVFIVGCNFGPCNSRLMFFFNKLFIKFFVTDICFRDLKSYKLFDNLKHSRYNPDIVFGLDVTRIDKLKIGNNNKVGICVMNFEDERINNRYTDKMAELTRMLCRENKKVLFFSFCKMQNDLSAYAKIKKKIGKSYSDEISLIEYDGNIIEFLMEYSKLTAVVTLRFHSLVLSQIMKINYYPIVYSNKTINLLQDQKFPYDYTKIENINKLNINTILEQLNKPAYSVKCVGNPLDHFAQIDKFINADSEFGK
jgi:colanic acid/amylovoran biosynthesis protein